MVSETLDRSVLSYVHHQLIVLDYDKDDGNGNSASQGIGQSQSSSQNSQVVSGENTEDSGNNISLKPRAFRKLCISSRLIPLFFL